MYFSHPSSAHPINKRRLCPFEHKKKYGDDCDEAYRKHHKEHNHEDETEDLMEEENDTPFNEILPCQCGCEEMSDLTLDCQQINSI